MAAAERDKTTTDEALSLVQLLCTRLCHDLAGPVGAVAAGVELAAGDPTQMDAETLGLIGSSSAAASRKLKFLRAAMGVPAAGQGAGLQALIEGYLEAVAGRSGVTALRWPGAAVIAGLTEHLGTASTPLLLNLCLLALEAVPVCRTLEIEVTNNPVSIRISAHEDPQRTSAWRPDVVAAVEGAADAPMTPRTIQAHMVRRMAGAAGGRIALETDPHILRALFHIPAR
jgi:histidine phosphotransferase ChpT